jgi:hypothetical protein
MMRPTRGQRPLSRLACAACGALITGGLARMPDARAAGATPRMPAALAAASHSADDAAHGPLRERAGAPGAPVTTSPFPVDVVAVAALDARGRVAAAFHRGDRVALRIRWRVRAAAPGDREVVIWVVDVGGQAVYRHYRPTMARVGRWRWTTAALIPRTARTGVYTFEGKVVVGRKQSYRIFTFRVLP